MSKDNLDRLFERLHGDFDIEEPQSGHQERFLEKLNQDQGTIALHKKNTSWWKHLSIAASVVLVALLGYQVLDHSPALNNRW